MEDIKRIDTPEKIQERLRSLDLEIDELSDVLSSAKMQEERVTEDLYESMRSLQQIQRNLDGHHIYIDDLFNDIQDSLGHGRNLAHEEGYGALQNLKGRIDTLETKRDKLIREAASC